MVASSACEECHLHFRSDEFQVPPFSPIDALSAPGLKSSPDLTYVAPSGHPSDIVHEGETIDCADRVLHL